MLRYTTFYSQILPFFRLCNNTNNFLFRVTQSYSKLVIRGYVYSLLFEYLKRFYLTYKIYQEYGKKNICENNDNDK